MGSRLFSNTSLLLGGRDFTNRYDRQSAAEALRMPVELIPTGDSKTYDQILEAVEEGQVKGLWIIGTNPAHSWIGKTGLADLFGKLEFLVVQDIYASTETAQLADLILPAAGWGEKEGTFINSERRLGVIKKVARAPGQALADFHIFRLIAHYWGSDGLFREWTSPQAVFQILKRCSAGQPCDITGIEDFRMIDAAGGIQWPYPVSRIECRVRNAEPTSFQTPHSSLHTSNERRLFEDRRFFHADGKARFVFEQPREHPELPNADYPFVLLTGRGSSAQWHTGTRTKKSDVLRRLSPRQLFVEIHPQDARRFGIRHHSKVRIRSRRGEVTAHALVTATQARGQVFLPMHDCGTNRLTFPAFDPYSRQPAYKFCAVKIERLSK